MQDDAPKKIGARLSIAIKRKHHYPKLEIGFTPRRGVVEKLPTSNKDVAVLDAVFRFIPPRFTRADTKELVLIKLPIHH